LNNKIPNFEKLLFNNEVVSHSSYRNAPEKSSTAAVNNKNN
jgi:hypothetical protein